MRVGLDYFKQFRRMLTRRDWLMMLLGVAVTLLFFGVITLIKHAQQPLNPQSSDITIAWLPGTVKQWRGQINTMAKKYDIDPDLIAIIMTMESGGYAKAKSEVGAQGLMQVTPLTAKDIASKYLKKPVTHYNLMDPPTNIEFGTAYLALLRDEFGSWQQGPSWNSTVELIAAGYNGGFGAANNLEQGKGLRDPQTVIYSRDAFNMWRERHSRTSPTYERWLERGGYRLVDAAKSENH